MTGQVLPQVEEERRDVAATGRIAGSQPQLRHQAHLRNHRQQRMQTRLESLPGVTDRHAFLMAVLVQEPRRIQVQRAAIFGAGQSVQTPMPQRTETPQIGPRRIKTLEESGERRLAGHPAHADQLRHHRIAP